LFGVETGKGELVKRGGKPLERVGVWQEGQQTRKLRDRSGGKGSAKERGRSIVSSAWFGKGGVE